MNEDGKSDSLIVTEKHLNKGSVNLRPAEGVEERRLGEGNPIKPNRIPNTRKAVYMTGNKIELMRMGNTR